MNETHVTRAISAAGMSPFELAGWQPETAEFILGLKRRAEGYITSARRRYPSMPPISFGYADSGELNACAFRHDNQYFIIFNAGVPLIFALLFGRILAEPTYFKSVGNPSEEISGLPVFHSLSPDVNSIRNQAAKALSPRNEPRRVFSRNLISIAFDFLVGHEIAHIIHGHVDYYDKGGSSPFIAEFTPSSTPHSSPSIIRQTLEIDADSSSVIDGLNSIYYHIENNSQLPVEMQSFYATRDDAIFNLMFAVLSLFRLFGDASFAISSLAKSDYPPTRVRQVMCLSAVMTYLQRCEPSLTDDEAIAISGKALIPVEHVFANLTGTSFGPLTGLQDAISPEALLHQQSLLRCWQDELRDKLLPFSYAPLMNMSAS